MARKGYIGAGALTPAIFAFLVGLIQYPPTGIARVIAPFILSLWFPGIALLVLGLVYWFLSIRTEAHYPHSTIEKEIAVFPSNSI
ncbi:MAG TPA: hypothetical protein VJQ26_08090 [Ktedonobacteraceae bacterium]|nr:hypothetical protein [Ktedonobacteraceae bacterium]